MTLSQRLLAATFIGSGVLHLVVPSVYESIVPDYLPAHREIVLASGVAEIALGAGVVSPATRRLAGWGLIALLAAIFPANLHMALHPDRYDALPAALLWARLPLQGALMWWARRATR